MPYKAKTWHALSHEQCYLTHQLLDICRSAFKINLIELSWESYCFEVFN